MTTAERPREFWRRTLLDGAFTALPRWTRMPVAGVREYDARVSDELAAALRRLADELAVPLSSVLLTAHAKVLGVLSGEREVTTGYAVRAGSPLPCRRPESAVRLRWLGGTAPAAPEDGAPRRCSRSRTGDSTARRSAASAHRRHRTSRHEYAPPCPPSAAYSPRRSSAARFRASRPANGRRNLSEFVGELHLYGAWRK